MATLPPAPVWNQAKESRAEYMKRYNAWRAQLEAVRAQRYVQVAQSHRAPAKVVRKAKVVAAKKIKAAAKVAPKPTTQPKPTPKPTTHAGWTGTGEPAPIRQKGESITDFKARYEAWRIAQQQAHAAAKAQMAKEQIAMSSASPELKASETALLEAARAQEEARAAARVVEAQKRAEEAAKIARQQQILDEARLRRASAISKGGIAMATALNAEKAQEAALAATRHAVGQSRYERVISAQERERWIQHRKNQLIEEARQAMIHATGRVIAPEQEGRVIAQAIRYAQAEYDYEHGLSTTPPPEEALPKFDLTAPPAPTTVPTVPGGGGGGTTPPPTYEPTPAEQYETTQTAAATYETQQASDLLAKQQAAQDQSTYLYQLISRLHEIPFAQGPVILEAPASQALPIPPPSQLPAVLLGIAGGAVLVAGLMGR